MRRRVFLLAAAPVFAGACAGDAGDAGEPLQGRSGGRSGRASGEPAPAASTASTPVPNTSSPASPGNSGPAVYAAEYGSAASEWGERVTGVKNRLDTDERVVALTFDACGGPNGSGYDHSLIEFLRANHVPATLFINDRWTDANREPLLELAADSLFEIANHGTEHRPLSVSGAEVYGIEGTSDPAGVIAEVGDNQATLAEAIGEPPAYFRAGTAYYDEIAVEIANDMGLEVVGFDILGDAGATFTADEVASALREASAGSIALLHMNHPGSGTAAGVERAVADLRGRGFEFVTLSEFPLSE